MLAILLQSVYICAIIMGIVLGGVLLLDLLFVWRDWFGRIHIGRWSDRQRWLAALQTRALTWLRRTPRQPLTDQARWVAFDMVRGQYGQATLQSWQETALVLGLSTSLQVAEHMAAKGTASEGEISKDTATTRSKTEQRIARTLERFIRSKIDANGHWRSEPRHVENAMLAYQLMQLSHVPSTVFEPALHATWRMIEQQIGADGTVLYRQERPTYRYVDTIGFICPFLIAYGVRYDKPRCIALAMKQIAQFVAYGMLPQHFIPCHAYAIDTKLPLGLYGWGRGAGWFALGLIDAWRTLPCHHPARKQLERWIIPLAESLSALQQQDGSWHWMMMRDSRPDASTIAMLAWFMAHATSIEAIATICEQSCTKAINYLMKVTRRNGAVDFSQGDTLDIGVYSKRFAPLPFTQGYALGTVALLQQRSMKDETAHFDHHAAV